MGRPRKGAGKPDTRLVALRLPGDLLARLDAYARRAGTTRSGALRDLVARGLAAAGAAEARSGAAGDARAGSARCAWCHRPRGEDHLEGCPHRPDSALRAFVRGARRGRRR